METFGPVKSPKELKELGEQLKHRFDDSLLLFRGQNELYEKIKSGRSRPNYRPVPLVELGWSALASRLLGLPVGSTHLGMVQAILQHYGCATHFVDLTSDINVAAWFATHTFTSSPRIWVGNALRTYDLVDYPKICEKEAYVMVLSIPNPAVLQERDRLIDISSVPIDFLRPHRQSAWLLLDRPPTIPTPTDYWVATIKIDSSSFEYEFEKSLFPSSVEDPAFEELLRLPFVQLPMEYLGSRGDDVDEKIEDSELPKKRKKDLLGKGCFAIRVLDIPEYCGNEDHIWNDLTIYEPHPMRMWKGWCADLEAIHGGIKGNIRDAVKITITPSAMQCMESAEGVELIWPEIGSDGCFFTFAALDHDKVIEHGPPYFGVWLQRDRDLIVEVPMTADHETLSTCAGHSYFLRNGEINRQEMATSCKCDQPESHDARVSSVLRLQKLVQEGQIILLPHPRFETDWYFAITGDDAKIMKPNVDSGRVLHRAVMDSLKSSLDGGPKDREAEAKSYRQ